MCLRTVDICSVETALRCKGCICLLCWASNLVLSLASGEAQKPVFRGVRTGNPSGLTRLAVASSQRVDAVRFGQEARPKVWRGSDQRGAGVHSLTCKTEAWPNM